MAYTGRAPSDAIIDSAAIADGGVATVDIADGAVTSPKIAAKGIQANNIADGIITSAQISAGGVAANAIATGAVTALKIANTIYTTNAYFSVPTGTTSDRPGSPVKGHFRYNGQTGSAEIYDGSAWGTVGGGATGGGSDDVFYENSANVTVNYTITSGKNAMSAGPITIDTGVAVTVPTGSVWTIV